MLYHQLNRIREQLALKDLSVSDGLLLTSRALRGKLADSRLLWLNRELLGYRSEDLEALNEKEAKRPGFSKIVQLIAPAKKPELEVPVYRFLSGTWGRIDEAGKLTQVREAQLIEKSIFCNIGMQQLEAQLGEMEDPMEGLFSMSFDQRTGAEFYCYSHELVRIQEAVRDKLCEFIDDSVSDLKLTPHSEQ